MQRGLGKLANSGKLRAKMEILRLGLGHREGKSSEVSFVNVAGQQKREAAFTVKTEAVAGLHVAENAGAIDDSRLARLTKQNGGVAEFAADFRDHTGYARKQHCPRRLQ